MDFPLYFQKIDLALAELYFHRFFSSEIAKPLKIHPSIRFGGVLKPDFHFLCITTPGYLTWFFGLVKQLSVTQEQKTS